MDNEPPPPQRQNRKRINANDRGEDRAHHAGRGRNLEDPENDRKNGKRGRNLADPYNDGNARNISQINIQYLMTALNFVVHIFPKIQQFYVSIVFS